MLKIAGLIASIFFWIPFTQQAFANDCLLNWANESLRLEAQSSLPADTIIFDTGNTPLCGGSSSFLNTFGRKENIIKVKAGGKTLSLMPLALYRKERPSKCNTIKVRTACFTVKQNGDGSTELTLFDRDRATKTPATFEITSDGQVKGIFSEFAVVRATFGKKQAMYLPTRIIKRMDLFENQSKTCRTRSRQAVCTSGLEAVAESVALEHLRNERFPRSLTPGEVNDDWMRFNARFGDLSGIAKIINKIMIANEAGTTSPNEVSDATLDASALSFGARQLDVGGNRIAQNIFSENLKDIEAREEWKEIGKDREFIYSRDFMRPIRSFAPEQLFALHRAVPTIDVGMRGNGGLQRYNDHHEKFLKEESQQYLELRKLCLFKKSPFLALVAIDRRNQRPKDFRTIKARVAKMCKQGTSVSKAEEEIVKFYGRYVTRPKNIRTLVNANGLE